METFMFNCTQIGLKIFSNNQLQVKYLVAFAASTLKSNSSFLSRRFICLSCFVEEMNTSVLKQIHLHFQYLCIEKCGFADKKFINGLTQKINAPLLYLLLLSSFVWISIKRTVSLEQTIKAHSDNKQVEKQLTATFQ